jgi:hypothetical protein
MNKASVHFLPNVSVLRIAQCSQITGMRSYCNDTRHAAALFPAPPRRGWVPFGVFCRDEERQAVIDRAEGRP